MLNNYIVNGTVIFVTKFEIKEDHIEVFYSNNTSEIIKKTPENQEKLLAKMTSQVPTLKNCVLKIKKELMKYFIYFGISLAGFISSGFLLYHVAGTGWLPIITAFLFQLISAAGVVWFGLSTFALKSEYTALSNESEKFNMWLENQQLLEKHISTDNIVDQTGIVKNRSLDGNINVNVVDIMNLTTLKELVLACQKKEFSNDLEHFTQELGRQRTMGTMPGSGFEK